MKSIDRPRQAVVVLTGTVRPAVSTAKSASDPAVREAEYAEGLRAARRQLPGTRIVFVENSGRLGSLAGLCGDLDIEVLDASGPSSEVPRGKGAGEIAMLGEFVRGTPWSGDEVICKVTGRYRVKNLGEICRSLETVDADLMANLYVRMTYGDSRVFGFRPNFMSILESYAPRINDAARYWMEHALAAAALELRAAGGRWSYLPQYPVIEGRRGTTGAAYTPTRRRVLVEQLKLAAYRRLYGQPAAAHPPSWPDLQLEGSAVRPLGVDT